MAVRVRPGRRAASPEERAPGARSGAAAALEASMSDRVSTVVLVVKPGGNPRRASEIRRWIRALVPAALILVSSVPLATAGDDVVTVSADEIDAGPLAVAAALTRPRHPRD